MIPLPVPRAAGPEADAGRVPETDLVPRLEGALLRPDTTWVSVDG